MKGKAAFLLFIGVLMTGLAVPALAAATTLIQSEDYPSEVTGEDTGEAGHSFIFEDEVKVTCKQVTFSGAISEPSESLTAAPTYSECTSYEGKSATVAINSCTYQFAGGEEASENHFHGTMAINCPSEKQIVITAGTCEVQITTQSAHNEDEFANEGSESSEYLKVHWANTELKYTKAKDGTGCPLTGTGSKTDGKYQGDGKMQAKKDGNAQGMAMGKEVETMLCEEQVKSNCKKPIKKQTAIKMVAKTTATLELVGNASVIGCTTSEITTANEVEKKVTLPLEKFAITFGNCSVQPANKKCAKVTMTNANPAAVLTTTLFGPGSGVLLTPITLFLECEANSVTCEYKTARALALVAGGAGGGELGETNFVGQTLDKQALGGGMKEAGCSAVLAFLGSYDIEEPEPIWVTQP